MGGVVRRSVLLVGGLSVLGAPVLTACLGRGRGGGSAEPTGGVGDASGGAGGGGASSSASGGTTSVDPGQGVKRTVSTVGASLEVTVGPAVVSDEVMVVPLAVHLDEPWSTKPPSAISDDISISLIWNGIGNFSGADGVRLVDFDAGTVQETYKATSEPTEVSEESADTVLHAFFKPVAAERINVLIPQTGLFVDVPVVPEGELSAQAQKILGWSKETENNPDPVILESYTAAVDGASDTRVTEKSVTVTLAADVLFAVDSAELSDEADTALQGAADQLTAYSGGEVSVVGHTDDVADDAHNQDLSARRAQAVADRLGQLTDMSAFTVTVSGKGESEPRVPNDSDENRQLNRRVEVILVPTQEVSERKGTDKGGGELPAPQGPTGKGDEGVTVSWGNGDGEAIIALGKVTRYGNYLVGEVKFTGGVGGSGASPSGWLQPTGIIQNARGESDGGLVFAVTGLSLLTPQERYYAVDYAIEGGTNRPLSELDAKDELGEGDTTTLTVVWPDTGQDTVTLDLEAPAKNAPQSNNPFRLTDIPVVEP